MTNAEARFNKSLRPRKPESSLGRTAQDGHLDSHTAPELWEYCDNVLNPFTAPAGKISRVKDAREEDILGMYILNEVLVVKDHPYFQIFFFFLRHF